MDKISKTEAFLVACDYAQLVHASEITNPLDPVAGAAVIGARRVLEILKTIADKDPPEKPKRTVLNVPE